MNVSKWICLFIYYFMLRYFPASTFVIRPIGLASKKLRYFCCKRIFKFCGENVNIERKVFFGSGFNICIGSNSGIGINACIPPDTIIGKDVMMAPNCVILSQNHKFDRVDLPIMKQGESEPKKTIIEDDVWIGQNVIMTPGRILKRGTIIGAGCVLSKDFPEYSIVGGNPSSLIRLRLK